MQANKVAAMVGNTLFVLVAFCEVTAIVLF